MPVALGQAFLAGLGHALQSCDCEHADTAITPPFGVQLYQ